MVFGDPLDWFNEVGVERKGLSQLHLHALVREREGERQGEGGRGEGEGEGGREGEEGKENLKTAPSIQGLLCHCTLKNAWLSVLSFIRVSEFVLFLQ